MSGVHGSLPEDHAAAARTRAEVREPLFTLPFLLLSTATFAFFAAEAMLFPLLPRLVREAGAPGLAGLAIGATSITALLGRPLAGQLAGRGRDRGMLLIGAAGYAVVAVGVLVTHAPVALIALRGLQGAALAVFYAAVSTTLTALSPASRRGEAFSHWSTSIYLGIGGGPVLSEWLAGRGGTTAVAIGDLTLALLALVLVLGVPRQAGAAAADAPRGALLHRGTFFPAACLGLCGIGWGVGVTFVPLRADELGLSGASAYFAAFGLGVVGVRIGSARLSDRFGRAVVVAPGLALGAAGMALLAPARSVAALAAGGALYGAGYGLVFPGLMAYITDRVPAAERGPALATYAMSLDLAIGSGPLLLGPLAGGLGYQGLFLVAAGLGLVGLGVFLVGARRQGTLRLGPPAGPVG